MRSSLDVRNELQLSTCPVGYVSYVRHGKFNPTEGTTLNHVVRSHRNSVSQIHLFKLINATLTCTLHLNEPVYMRQSSSLGFIRS